MSLAGTIAWSDRLTRLSFALLLLATASGIVVGAAISMYYDLAPTLVSLDQLPFVFYVVAIIVSLPHLLLAASDVTHNQWKQASMRALVFIGPLIVFVGTEGLLSHFLWWEPISQTGRFHLLHHTVSAGAPLTLAYWLLLRWWWRPATISKGPALSPKFWLVNTILLVLVVGTWLVADSVDLLHPYQGPIVLVVVGLGLVADLLAVTLPRRWRHRAEE